MRKKITHIFIKDIDNSTLDTLGYAFSACSSLEYLEVPNHWYQLMVMLVLVVEH